MITCINRNILWWKQKGWWHRALIFNCPFTLPGLCSLCLKMVPNCSEWRVTILMIYFYWKFKLIREFPYHHPISRKLPDSLSRNSTGSALLLRARISPAVMAVAARAPSADVWDALCDKKENLQPYCHSFITCMVTDTITTAASVVIETHLLHHLGTLVTEQDWIALGTFQRTKQWSWFKDFSIQVEN